jgi:hypothetical protein
MRIFKTPSNHFNFNPKLINTVSIKEFGVELSRLITQIEPNALDGLRKFIHTKQMFNYFNWKLNTADIFHPSIGLELSKVDNTQYFYRNSTVIVDEENPNSLLVINQSSKK